MAIVRWCGGSGTVARSPGIASARCRKLEAAAPGEDEAAEGDGHDRAERHETAARSGLMAPARQVAAAARL